MERIVIGIVGNPNCGKTTLFNALTGARQRVGNWPGVTVDRKVGFLSYGDTEIEVVDTPGIYSMSASSLDEKVARDFVLSGEADIIVNIVDASNLERNPYLTLQLLEMEVPVVIALNMMDVASKKGVPIDVKALEAGLGCMVIPMVASKGEGIEELKAAALEGCKAGIRSSSPVPWPDVVRQAVDELKAVLERGGRDRDISLAWLAIKLLEADPDAIGMASQEVRALVRLLQDRIEAVTGEEADVVIASARYGYISSLCMSAAARKTGAGLDLSDRIDRVVLHRVLGIPVFLLAMYLMFLFVINVGGAFIDFFDILGGALFVDLPRNLLVTAEAPQWLITMVADGIGGGLQTMATFIPPIGFMFLCLSFLEDSGYMARAAFVMDRFMRFIGLPGKSFIPMLVGFGCNVPAIMATRTLENQRDRLLTIMMNPFMSCGARLPVYTLFAAVFFASSGQNLVFLLYLIGIAAAIFTGMVLKNTLLKGEISPFVMELPPYHMPTARSVLLRTYERLQAFLFKAGRVLIPVILVLTLLNSLGTDGSLGNQDSPKSVLAAISRTITPAFSPMGITRENWPATVGIFTGIFAKEAVVGTLNSLYSASTPAEGTDQQETGLQQAWIELKGGVKEAFSTIPANLGGIITSLGDPLGIGIDVSDRHRTAEELEVEQSTLSSMALLFGSKAAAFSYLVFILLYFPCSAAIAAVYRETGLKWTIFAGSWTTFLAWSLAVLTYQCATFSIHPTSSAAWIAGVLAMLGAVTVLLYLAGSRKRGPLAGREVIDPAPIRQQ